MSFCMEQLKVLAKETLIASCNPDQVSDKQIPSVFLYHKVLNSKR